MSVEFDYNPSDLAKKIAKMPGVQAALRGYVSEARVRASNLLMQAKNRQGLDAFEVAGDPGRARIEIKGPPKSKVDWYLVLNDEGGQHAAAAIEYGRKEYAVRDDHGKVIYTVPAAKGLYVLHKAMGARIRSR